MTTEHKPAEINQDALRAAKERAAVAICASSDPGWIAEKVVSAYIAAIPQEGAAVAPTFQARVDPWGIACFREVIWNDKLERGDRATEEHFEMLQAAEYPRERIRALEEYVYSRPKGNLKQEVGGVMVTLAAFCLAHGVDMHEAGETELARIWTKVEAIRAKQAAKPTGSALPIAPVPSPAAGVDAVQATEEADNLKKALRAAMLYTDEKQDLGGWRAFAHFALGEYHLAVLPPGASPAPAVGMRVAVLAEREGCEQAATSVMEDTGFELKVRFGAKMARDAIHRRPAP